LTCDNANGLFWEAVVRTAAALAKELIRTLTMALIRDVYLLLVSPL
jgi:hypothetical protein